MKDFIKNIKDRARSDPKRIAFPESTEERTLKAIEKVLEEGTAKPILIGDEQAIRARIGELGLNIVDVQFVDHLSDANKDHFEKYVNKFVELRQSKGMTYEKAYVIFLSPSCLLISCNKSTSNKENFYI